MTTSPFGVLLGLQGGQGGPEFRAKAPGSIFMFLRFVHDYGFFPPDSVPIPSRYPPYIPHRPKCISIRRPQSPAEGISACEITGGSSKL